jgi:hypothetical protein
MDIEKEVILHPAAITFYVLVGLVLIILLIVKNTKFGSDIIEFFFNTNTSSESIWNTVKNGLLSLLKTILETVVYIVAFIYQMFFKNTTSNDSSFTTKLIHVIPYVVIITVLIMALSSLFITPIDCSKNGKSSRCVELFSTSEMKKKQEIVDYTIERTNHHLLRQNTTNKSRPEFDIETLQLVRKDVKQKYPNMDKMVVDINTIINDRIKYDTLMKERTKKQQSRIDLTTKETTLEEVNKEFKNKLTDDLRKKYPKMKLEEVNKIVDNMIKQNSSKTTQKRLITQGKQQTKAKLQSKDFQDIAAAYKTGSYNKPTQQTKGNMDKYDIQYHATQETIEKEYASLMLTKSPIPFISKGEQKELPRLRVQNQPHYSKELKSPTLLLERIPPTKHNLLSKNKVPTYVESVYLSKLRPQKNYVFTYKKKEKKSTLSPSSYDPTKV